MKKIVYADGLRNYLSFSVKLLLKHQSLPELGNSVVVAIEAAIHVALMGADGVSPVNLLKNLRTLLNNSYNNMVQCLWSFFQIQICE